MEMNANLVFTSGGDGEDFTDVSTLGTTKRSSERRPVSESSVDADKSWIIAVSDAESVILFYQSQTVRYVERTFVRADDLSFWTELENAAVAVSVSDEENARGGHSDVSRSAKMSIVRTRDKLLSQDQTRCAATFWELHEKSWAQGRDVPFK